MTDTATTGTAQHVLTEVRNEMKRVTWPSQREVYATTLVVIVFSALIGIYLFGVDLLHDTTAFGPATMQAV